MSKNQFLPPKKVTFSFRLSKLFRAVSGHTEAKEKRAVGKANYTRCGGSVMSQTGHPLTLQGGSRLNYSLANLASLQLTTSKGMMYVNANNYFELETRWILLLTNRYLQRSGFL